jgi:hypothetical protein
MGCLSFKCNRLGILASTFGGAFVQVSPGKVLPSMKTLPVRGSSDHVDASTGRSGLACAGSSAGKESQYRPRLSGRRTQETKHRHPHSSIVCQAAVVVPGLLTLQERADGGQQGKTWSIMSVRIGLHTHTTWGVELVGLDFPAARSCWSKGPVVAKSYIRL